jgi:hypothetical protein
MLLLPHLGAEFMARGEAATPDNLVRFCHEKGVPGF